MASKSDWNERPCLFQKELPSLFGVQGPTQTAVHSLCSWKISGENILEVYKSIKKIILSEVLTLGNLYFNTELSPAGNSTT